MDGLQTYMKKVHNLFLIPKIYKAVTIIVILLFSSYTGRKGMN